MEAFGHERKSWLNQYIGLENGIPSHDTFERVFQKVNPEYFRKSLYAITVIGIKELKEELIGIDGKKMRGNSPKSRGTDGLYIVTAWLSESCVSIAEQKVEEKSNEIKAIPKLLSNLEVEGCTISIDAMGCQTKIAELIRKKKADYLFGVKENQEQLLEELKESFFFARQEDQQSTLDYGHGRIERRRCSVLSAKEYLSPKQLGRWKDVESIVLIDSERIVGEKCSKEKRYYISSKKEDASYFNKSIRQHWSIENKLHWNLDVIMKEDKNRTRTGYAPENLNTMRKLALFFLSRKIDKFSKPKRRFKAALNTDYLEKILNGECSLKCVIKIN